MRIKSNTNLQVIFVACLLSIALANSTNLHKSKLKGKSESSSSISLAAKSLYDCTEVSENKTNYVQATCLDSKGGSITSEIDLNKCFGNDNGQLKCGGEDFIHSCDGTGVLVKTVTQEKSKKLWVEEYKTEKDGPYYLNASCNKGKKKSYKYGWSYTNIYDCIKVSEGKLSC